MKTIIELPKQAELLKRFEYRDGHIFWRAKNGDDRETRRWNARYAGTEAGHPSSKGYLQVKIDRRNYMVHRVIFVMIHGDVLNSETQVDHVKVVTSANRIEHLRAATHSQNAAYAKRRVDSTYGKGIKFKRGRYEAYINVRGKRIYIGSYREVEQARTAYAEAARKHFGEFARAA